ncbi:MAG: hypothetical protein LBT89_09510 [Planctomycetaceae bacterium]|jgi:hypothetical protein|nr:hypothetical protein [Planctomycetaceae bacterium]
MPRTNNTAEHAVVSYSARSAARSKSLQHLKTAAGTKKCGRPKNPYSPEDLLPFRKNEAGTLEQLERQSTPVKKYVRRRRTNPVTSIQDYAADEIEFMNALAEYKRSSGRVFPTCSEILAVLKALGYNKGSVH